MGEIMNYSNDINVIVSQINSANGVVKVAKADQTVANLVAVAAYGRNATKWKMTQKEFGKATGLSQSDISKALDVLRHDDARNVLAKNKKDQAVDQDIYGIICELVTQYGGKAISGIHTEMFGAPDNFDLAKAVATLLASASKRNISTEQVLAEFDRQVNPED
jgi:hypothetical protein